MESIYSKIIASLSYLKVNYDVKNSNFLDNFIPFLGTLAYKKRYREVLETEDGIIKIVTDFKEEFGLDIPYHPLLSIINRSIKKGLIKKQEHKFIFTDELYKFDFSNEISEYMNKHKVIIDSFVEFAKESYKIQITPDEAEKTLVAFLKKYDLDMLFVVYKGTQVPNIDISEKNLFIFSKFIYNIYNKYHNLFNLFLDLVIGHTLVNVVFLEDKIKEFVNPKLEGLNIYLDTRIIFRLLGVDSDLIKDSYEKLLKEFKTQGINLFVFSHTYDEIMGILNSCLNWVDSPQYDVTRASSVLRFFRSLGYKKSDVQMFINRVDKILQENNILKIEPPSPDKNREYLINEKKLEEIIAKEYNYNPQFGYYNKDLTIRRDVNSISSIYLLRKGSKPVNIKQANAIFLTTNSALAHAVRVFEKDNLDGDNNFYIPACLTDTFLGTVIWMRNPNKIIEISEKKIMANIYFALRPKEELIKKWVDNIEELKKRGEITEDDYILLRDSTVAYDYLMGTTYGCIENFNPKTSIEILENLNREGLKKYEEENKLHSNTKQELQKIKEEKEERERKYQDIAEKISKWIFIMGIIAIIILLITACFKIINSLYSSISSFLVGLCGIFGIGYSSKEKIIKWLAKKIIRKVYKIDN